MKYNAEQVAKELSAHQYVVFEYEAFGHIMRAFGVTQITARKWVNRAIASGHIVRNGKVALCLI